MSRHDPGLYRIRRVHMTVKVRRRLMVCGLIVLAGLIWAVVAMLNSPVQRTIVITTGAQGGIYQNFAIRYEPFLKREGIKLDIRSSSGSVQNYQRLTDKSSDVDIGFIQSGTTNPKETDHLQTIAAVSYEPVWVFYRGNKTMDRLVQLRGKRVSVGVTGSGLLSVATQLLAFSGINANNATLTNRDSAKAYQELEAGQLDAAFFIGRPDSPMQQKLLNSNLKLMSFVQADALAQRFPSLSKVRFPRASTSVADDLPETDVTLLAATALLVSKDTLPPALTYLLLDAAKTVHGHEDYFTPLGAFPNVRTDEFPVADESTRYFASGRPVLQRYLPFWLASFIEKRLLIFVPFMAIMIGLLQALPRMAEARIKNRLVVWYREIKSLEDEIWSSELPTRIQLEQWRDEIESLDAHASQIRIPHRYFKDVYALKQAIGVVRERISQVALKAKDQPQKA
jgi:TRAP transporter TAXI family solute receptor